MNGVVAAAGASSRSLDVRVACDEDGDAWPTRRSDNGNRFRADQQLLRYRLSCSLVLSIQPHPVLTAPTISSPLPPPSPARSTGVFVIVARFVSPFRPSIFPPGLRPVVLLCFFSRRSLSISLSLVSQTLAKPHLGDGLSCCTSS